MLVEDEEVAAFVASRVYSDILPQNAKMPAITYWLIAEQPYEHLSGIVDISKSTVQVDCFGATRESANLLADAVRLTLEKFRGTVDEQFINEINYVSARDGFDRPEAGTDERRFIRSMDFDIHYRTTTSKGD